MAGKLESMWKKLHMVPKTAKQIPSATVVTYPASVPVQYDMEASDDEVDYRKVATIEPCPPPWSCSSG